MEANQQASASFMESQEPTEKEETPEDLGHLGSGVLVVMNCLHYSPIMVIWKKLLGRIIL